MEKLTHWKKTCNPNYLGSWDLPSDGNQFQKIIVTIADIKTEEVLEPSTNRKTEETVCYFKENYKPMILNSTNKKAIAKATKSNYIEEWIGHKIKIGVEKVKAFGDIWDALRVVGQPVVVEMKHCECCGKEISEAIYNGTKDKCGYGVCSQECRDKMLNKETKANESTNAD